MNEKEAKNAVVEELKQEIEQLKNELSNLQNTNNALKETVVRMSMISVGTLQIGG